MITVHLPLKTVAGLNAREHWRKRSKRVKTERTTAKLVLTPHPKPEAFPIVVRMVRLSPGTLDSDNLQGAAKAIRDGVADWLGIPDNDPRIDWQYGQERCKRGEFGVRVEVICGRAVDSIVAEWSQDSEFAEALIRARARRSELKSEAIPVESLGRDA